MIKKENLLRVEVDNSIGVSIDVCNNDGRCIKGNLGRTSLQIFRFEVCLTLDKIQI